MIQDLLAVVGGAQILSIWVLTDNQILTDTQVQISEDYTSLSNHYHRTDTYICRKASASMQIVVGSYLSVRDPH
jgi:hypothetical protein